mmetsp:Transcript_73873/g.175842  ORF Transcript_73873/g.175842 Transcript_73873/m.175842 type:complete len:278 (+) Transcript_73873:75-908(+)
MACQNVIVVLLLAVLPQLATALGQVSFRKGGAEEQQGTIEIEPGPTQHLLSICNAFAFSKSLDITFLRTQQSLTGSGPLSYKQCREWSLPLEEGDQLDFKADSISVGTFHVTGLPKSASKLLLITRRRNPHAMALAFQSHTYADSNNAQIAVVDAFSGFSDGSHMEIEDSAMSALQTKDGEHKQRRTESLKYNSVTLLSPGHYDVVLFDADGRNVSTAPLNVAGQGKYVAVRVGADGGEENSQFPMELVVFPNSYAQPMTCFKVLFAVLGLAMWRLL